MRLFVLFLFISAWIIVGLVYCHHHDLQAMRQSIQDKQGLSRLEELK